ncbi:hypothetical protein [Nocardioides pacificus]
MSDELDRIHADLAEDGVYVHPSLREYVDDAEVAQIQTNIAASDVAVFVVVEPYSDDDPWTGEPEELLARLHDRYPEPGLYVSNGRIVDLEEYGYSLVTRDYTAPGSPELDDFLLGYVPELEQPDDLGAGLVALTDMVATDTAQERYDAVRQESTGSSPDSEDPGAGGDPSGLLVAGLVLALVVTAGWGWTRHRAGRRRGGFVLPESAVDRIRDANDRQLLKRAERELLTLGEAIDHADMSEAHDAGAWQAALDHYDGARRVLRRGDPTPDVLDVVGAIVLAGRGEGFLAAALSGRGHEPAVPCFLNPLHGEASGSSPVQRGETTVKVPLCPTCRADLKAKRRPDTLDVLRKGQPVHYFDTTDEPWASTGYGALEPDLLPRLHGTR